MTEADIDDMIADVDTDGSGWVDYNGQSLSLDVLSVGSIRKQVAQLWQRDRASSINDFRRRVNLRLNYRLKGYFWRHCDMTQFTLTHHMVNKPFLLLGLSAEYR